MIDPIEEWRNKEIEKILKPQSKSGEQDKEIDKKFRQVFGTEQFRGHK